VHGFVNGDVVNDAILAGFVNGAILPDFVDSNVVMVGERW
jgi:hypothetical protein